MKTKIEQAKSILSISNKELSELLGHHERYIDRVLREGVSLAQEKAIIKDIDDLLQIHVLKRRVQAYEVGDAKSVEQLQESKQNIMMLNMEVAQLNSDKEKLGVTIGIAERDKRYMKRKLHDKSLVINWLLASNVFFVLFLIGKYLEWL